jgi:hypothetical protein
VDLSKESMLFSKSSFNYVLNISLQLGVYCNISGRCPLTVAPFQHPMTTCGAGYVANSLQCVGRWAGGCGSVTPNFDQGIRDAV